MTISSGSSIDVNTIVSQLMTIERRPLDVLNQRETDTKSKLTAYGRVQSAVSNLQTSIAALRQAQAFQAAKATVTGEGATAVTGTGAITGRFSLSVTQLARAQTVASTAVATADTAIGTGALTIRSADGSTVLATIDVGDTGTGTLAEVRDEINAAGIAVKASLVNDGGQVRLIITSSQTGVANGFQVSADPGLTGLSLSTPQAAQDASYTLNGLPLTSASNTIQDVVAGLTVTLTRQPPAGSPPGTTVDAEIAVDLDADTVRKGVEDFVKAYNSLDSLIRELTKYDPATKTAALLNGDSVLRQLQSRVRGLVTGTKTGGAAGEFTRLTDVGVELQRDGTLKVNTTKFNAAVTGDSAKVARLFTTDAALDADKGFALRLDAQLKSIVGTDGMLEARTQSLQASIRTLDQAQERLTARMALIEARLRTEYSKLDTLLSTRQQQSNALGNALAGLSSGT
jgi:flagellar hook-associated protein 2